MTAPSGMIVEAASAKLNLYLHVLGRRADGYHELDSLVAFADIHDTVTVSPNPDLNPDQSPAVSLAIDGPFAPALLAESSADNLVTRAARLLAEATGRAAPGVAITLTKRLPVASGIGGGSADAAACLRALARLWDIPLTDPVLPQLAARLGADVPVCLAGRPSWLGGIGERLDPAPVLPPCAVVLVNPGVPLATPAVFRARTGPFSQPARFTEHPADARDLARLLAGRGNDLAPPAEMLAPVICDVLNRLSETPGCLLARLSGSGATCFALYADPEQAKAAAAALASEQPGWWVRPGSLLP
jgi:4-diphosphocytidyl-2-C-methyl-D-erythritol kinase